jgi:hypothetical protein
VDLHLPGPTRSILRCVHTAGVTSVTLALHAALTHLLTGGPLHLAHAGLDDLDRFVRDLLDAVYPPAD